MTLILICLYTDPPTGLMRLGQILGMLRRTYKGYYVDAAWRCIMRISLNRALCADGTKRDELLFRTLAVKEYLLTLAALYILRLSVYCAITPK